MNKLSVRVRKKKNRPASKLQTEDLPTQVAILYKEDRRIRDALRTLAIKQGHNSIGKIIRNAVLRYLSDEDPDGNWKIPIDA